MASCAPTGAIDDLGIILNSATVQSRIQYHWSNRALILKARTMTEPTLTCPTCRTQIKLTESLAAPLIADTRRRYEDQLARKEAEVAGREAAIRNEQAQIAAARDAIDAQVAAKVDEERGRIAAAEAQKAKRLVAIDVDAKVKEIAELNQVLQQRDAKLAEAQQAQADLIRKQRELDDAKREMELTIQKQVQAELGTVRDQAKQEAETALTLRVREKEEQIASMQRQIEDLRRKAEQGSQQLQGEVQELALEGLLRQKFPRDAFEPVPKGEFGGDLIQHVIGLAGQICGSILWEAKRTKNWSDGWLAKVRDDQRAAKADIAIIVSHALPKGLQTFDQIDGVWVTEPRCAVAVAIALRESLIALAAARIAREGEQTKMELVYQYLTGPRFRHRIEAVVERFSEMQEDLDRERKTMMRLWAKREEQIHGVVESTAGLYGDLQGIAGRSLLEIEGLEIPLLDGPAAGEAAE
jgi:hypothetical protein